MPFNSESPYSESRREFCLALKAARERKGITLAQIADSTKISAYMFAALERNDLRRWPKGLFRRSFFRDYARMIGLPPEACDEFVRLFPDDPGSVLAKGVEAARDADRADDLRLAFDVAWHGPRTSVLMRLLAVLIDAAIVVSVAAALAWVQGLDWSTAAAIVAMTYLSLATAIVGESPAKWALCRHRSVLDALAQGRTAVSAVWSRGAEVISLFGNTDGGTPDQAARLRVRVKMSQ